MPKEYPVHPIPVRVFSETDSVWIVAGGSSLRGFQWERLSQKKVIAINRAYQTCPNAKILYWADDYFWEKHKDAIMAHKAPYKVTAYSDHVRFLYPEGIHTYKFTRLRGFDDSPAGICTGNNSGYSSINLAVKLGARRLFLLGYDLKFGVQGATHWHDGHGREHREETLVRKMLPHFESLVVPLQEKRVTVYNCSKDSNLTLWPRITIDEAFEIAQ